MKARGQVRKMLIVIGELQSLIAYARSEHYNDRSQMAFVNGQNALEKAFQLCVDTTSEYDPIVVRVK